MKAKKKLYKEGGILPPAIQKLKDRAAAKKAEKDAPIYDGIVGETTVTAKMPEGSPTLKREENAPVGSNFTFMGSPAGKVGSVGKVSKYLRAGKRIRPKKPIPKVTPKTTPGQKLNKAVDKYNKPGKPEVTPTQTKRMDKLKKEAFKKEFAHLFGRGRD